MWDVTAEDRAVMGVDVLRRLGELSGVQTWPVVLDIRTAHEGVRELADANAAADGELADLGIIREAGEPVAWAAVALRVLAAADRQIEIRTVRSAGLSSSEPGIPQMRRICLARNGHDHVLARRDGATVDVRTINVTSEGDVATTIARELDEQTPRAAFAAFGAPADELAARLSGCATAQDAADALHALGAPGSDAVAIASALMSCHSRSEIVAISRSDGVSTQSSGAVAVFDTERGRIVASPSKSPDGRVWTTLSPGGGHRIGQAIGLLIETLPEGRWMP